MIVWGTCAGGRGEKFDIVARPWIERAAGPGDRIEVRFGDEGICAAYNALMEVARAETELEALVLLHDDVELVDPAARDTIVAAVARPGTGILGVVGGSELRDGCWWRARAQAGFVRDARGTHDLGTRDAAVDVVDGLCLILSPRAVAMLCFDEWGFPRFHGYDADICLASRRSGFENRVIPMDVVHRDKAALGDSQSFREAQRLIRAKYPEFVRPDAWTVRAMGRCRESAVRLRHRAARVKRDVIARR